MNELSILSKSPLFKGMAPNEIKILLECMGATFRHYKKGETIIYESQVVDDLGIILSGTAQSKKLNIFGKQIIISMHYPGGYTALLSAISNKRKCPMSIHALEPLKVVSIPVSRLFSYYPKYQSLHQRFLINLYDSTSERALELHDRNDCLIMPTIRDKVLTFLTQLVKSSGSDVVYSPFNREEMAEYLDVDRSALSRELSRMRHDQLIVFRKNEFKVLKINEAYIR